MNTVWFIVGALVGYGGPKVVAQGWSWVKGKFAPKKRKGKR